MNAALPKRHWLTRELLTRLMLPLLAIVVAAAAINARPSASVSPKSATL